MSHDGLIWYSNSYTLLYHQDCVSQDCDCLCHWWNEECIRTSGEMICEICGLPYWKHPQPAKKEAPTLVRACDGRLLKL